MTPKKGKVFSVAVSLVLLLIASGCPMYMTAAFLHDKAADEKGNDEELGADPIGIQNADAEITLAWDPPPDSVQAYKLFFRIHDTATWYSLADGLPADPAPEYTVQRGSVGNGLFDFGVKAVDSASAESEMHSSLETTAQPDTGWYLIWD